MQVFNPAAKPMNKGEPDFFTYTLNLAFAAGSVAAPINAQGNIQIDASSQFFWTALAYQMIEPTPAYTQQTNPCPAVTLLITDGGSSKQLMNAPQYLNTVAGVGGWPGRLIHPRLFDRASTINVQAVSQDTRTISVLQLDFIGFRVYG